MRNKIIVLGAVALLALSVSGCFKQQKIYSPDECQTKCLEQEYAEGQCLRLNEAGKEMKEIGPCLTTDSNYCGAIGQCQCYCSGTAIEPENSEESEAEIITEDISALLEKLRETTGLSFSEIQPVEMNWMIDQEGEIEELTLQGQGYEISGITNEQHQAVENFLINQEFVVNQYNIADGTVRGLVGYQKDQTVCAVSGGLILAEGEGVDLSKEYLEELGVKCAYLTSQTEEPADEESQNETEDGQKMEIEAGKEFAIILAANPTTGYQWNVEFNEEYVELLGREYAPSVAGAEESEPPVGAGGNESFNFKAIKKGTTSIKFTYQRPWEKDVLPDQTEIYTVDIK